MAGELYAMNIIKPAKLRRICLKFFWLYVPIYHVAKYLRNIELIEKFGKRVRETRERAGISQHELANLCDLDYSQINRIELGKINTSISHLFLLAEKLNVSPKELIDFEI